MQLTASGLGMPAGSFKFLGMDNPTEVEMVVEVTVNGVEKEKRFTLGFFIILY